MVAVKPHVGQLGIGAVMGYCSGKFLGNMGSMAAYYVGGAFCFLQVLNKSGWVCLCSVYILQSLVGLCSNIAHLQLTPRPAHSPVPQIH